MTTPILPGRANELNRAGLLACCLLALSACAEDVAPSSPTPRAEDGLATTAVEIQPGPTETRAGLLATATVAGETAAPALGTTPAVQTGADPDATLGMTGSASPAEGEASSPSRLPTGMQATASVSGMSYVLNAPPIFLFKLALPFDAGTAVLAVIDPATGEPGSLVQIGDPLLFDYSGFDPDESIDLGLYLLVPPHRGDIASVGAGRVAASRVQVDESGALRAVLDVPACAPEGDYLAIACRDADCRRAADPSVPTRAAWVRFHRASPVSPDQPPPPRPTLVQVDPINAFDGLNVRAAPGASSQLLHHLDPSSVVEVTADPSLVQGSPWYPVRDPITCMEGWVNGTFLKLEDLRPMPTPETAPGTAPPLATRPPFERRIRPIDPGLLLGTAAAARATPAAP